MNTSFYNGLNGMKTQQVGIDVWGDNIANINTTGYKQQTVDFSDLFSTTLNTSLSSPVTSDVGLSATATSTVMDLSQGSIVSTDSRFDLALSGKGWMAVKDINGETFYTRTGSFNRDSNGTLVTQSGDVLQVVNANNLVYKDGKWTFDATIPTDNLVNDNMTLSSISLPDNILFPAQATTKVKIGGNLPNQDIAPNPKPAVVDSDMGVLYNSDGQNINLINDQDVVFGFGDNIGYEKGLIRYNICIPNDKEDGEDININFDVNGENIKLTIPDGSTSKEISDAIAQELSKKGILYSKTDTSIQIKSDKGLEIKSNGGDLITLNSAMKKLIYNSENNEGNNFTTIQDFIDDLQGMGSFVYGDKAKVGLDDEGKIYIQNTTDGNDIIASSYATENSNDMFMQNLGRLGNIIKPNTASNSLAFTRNYQGFSGNIIDSEGNNNTLKFDFYKTSIKGDNTIWRLDIKEISPDGNVISTKTQDLTFDSIGGLVTPNSIDFDNNGTPVTIDLGGAFSGITATDKAANSFVYSQDGLVNGYLEDYDINANGEILATFSNSRSGVLGQIPIYHFQNEQGLDSIGADRFTPTSNSGDAFIYKGENGEYIAGADVKNYALESSNVNMAQAMTQIIVIQKAYDANSKSITTSDQMVKRAIDMKR